LEKLLKKAKTGNISPLSIKKGSPDEKVAQQNGITYTSY
jgi:hypothetical protein